MKRIVCIILSLLMLALGTACSNDKKEENPDSPPKTHVELGDIEYDKYEITVTEDSYVYCGDSYQLSDIQDILIEQSNDTEKYDIIDKNSRGDFFVQLVIMFEDYGIPYTVAGEHFNWDPETTTGKTDSEKKAEEEAQSSMLNAE